MLIGRFFNSSSFYFQNLFSQFIVVLILRHVLPITVSKAGNFSFPFMMVRSLSNVNESNLLTKVFPDVSFENDS